MAVSMIGGALASALLTCWFPGVTRAWIPTSLLLGAAFGFLGWFLSENLWDAVIVLIGTAFPGLVILSFVESGAVRMVTIAFIGGINTGKLAGGIYREFT